MTPTNATQGEADLVSDVKHALISLLEHPCPEVANPSGVPRRASVACIVRIRPRYAVPYQPLDEADIVGSEWRSRIDAFFDQPWVQNGDPEVLFIKRAARKGDPWTGHIALPGGKRDASDESDAAAAVRETSEEIGLNLDLSSVVHIGCLPQRIVTSNWGAIPLMVLCPFVYLLTEHDLPPLRLQPGEIASAHWVSIRALRSSALQTWESIDFSARFNQSRRDWFTKKMLRTFFGNMLFSAIRLVPSESLFSTEIPGFLPLYQGESSRKHFRRNSTTNAGVDRPLILWGLTHGVIADFLDLLSSHDTLQHWQWPVMSAPDIRLALYILAYRFRTERINSLPKMDEGPPYLIEEGFAADHRRSGDVPQDHRVDMDGLGIRGAQRIKRWESRSSAIGHLLDGYYDYIRQAILVSLVLRFGLAALAARFFMKRWRSKL